MRKRIILVFCLIAGLLTVWGFSKGSDKGVLSELDLALRNQPIYMAQHQLLIDSLKTQLNRHGLSVDQQFRLNNEVGRAYTVFITDSAMKYFDRSLLIANASNNNAWKDEVYISQALVLSVSGMYKEALERFYDIPRQHLPESLLATYYNCGRQIYSFLSTYTQNPEYVKLYNHKQYLYRDSLLMVLPPQTAEYKLYSAEQQYSQNNYKGAEEVLQELLQDVPEISNIYARAAFTMALIYKNQGNDNLYIYYLALSAISDVEASVKENAALQNLALSLYERGDLNRAYRYIKYSLYDAVFCNARLRTVEISAVLPVINASYQMKTEEQRRQLLVFLILVSVLSIFLIASLFWIYKQMKKLSSTESKLRQANHIKEEYIGHFLNLCSLYIEKLDRFRSTVNRKIMAGQTEELLKLTKSSQFASMEQKEFYASFDSAFLQIYPDFVKELNELLQPDERFVLKTGELLNTELRIFAIIRLGIDDSSKIANFLHYSINTIYTYRNKVKNKAIDRDNFEENLMNIGAVG